MYFNLRFVTFKLNEISFWYNAILYQVSMDLTENKHRKHLSIMSLSSLSMSPLFFFLHEWTFKFCLAAHFIYDKDTTASWIMSVLSCEIPESYITMNCSFRCIVGICLLIIVSCFHVSTKSFVAASSFFSWFAVGSPFNCIESLQFYSIQNSI